MQPASEQPAFSFESLVSRGVRLPAYSFFSARDGAQLQFRKYPCQDSQSKRVLILLHGSGWHCQQFFKMAPEMASTAHVYTPDFRGHGPNAQPRGDVSYVGQLEDDLEDFVLYLRKQHTDSTVTVLGHSSGGGLALRFASSPKCKIVDNFVFLSPYIHPNCPVTRKDQRWAKASLGKLIAIAILDSFGFKRFNSVKVVQFNMPRNIRDGGETLSYTYRMLASINPGQNYLADIKRISKPTLVLVGEKDEIFWPDQFKQVFGGNPNVGIKIIPSASHLSVLTNSNVMAEISSFMTAKDTVH